MGHPTRRLALMGVAALAAPAPALAQVNSPLDLGGGSRRARNVALTEKDELAMGAELYGRSIDVMGGAYPNRAVQSAVRKIAEPILATSARTAFSWEVTVVDSNEVNAWALPGGKIAVNKGLLRYAASEDELAAVIAHEMGHAELSHVVKESRSRAITGLILGAATAAASSSSSRDSRLSVGAGLGAVDLGVLALAASGYSRENEREADEHITTVFARTGHSVARGAGFYRTLLELAPPSARGRTSLFAGHPETRERLSALLARAPGAPPAAKDTPAFAQVKAVFPTRTTHLRG